MIQLNLRFWIVFILFSFLILPKNIHAQIKATTIEGKDVILNPNGTWEYVVIEKTEKEVTKDTIDCYSYIVLTEDKVGGDSFYSAVENIEVSNYGAKTFVIDFIVSADERTSELLILSIDAFGNSSCIDQGARVNFLFRDGSRLELISHNEFNCENNAVIYFNRFISNLQELQILTEKEIDIMRVEMYDTYVEGKFSVEESTIFKETISCISKKMVVKNK